MIISRGRSYIFVHIPKTGGNSLARALEARAMKDDIMLGDTPKARRRRHRVKGTKTRGRLWKHSTLADIDGLIAPADLDAMFCFTLVRNPWDRAAFAAQPAGRYMTDARGQERAAAYVRLEHLAADLAPVEAHLGFALDVPHENRSDRGPDWRRYYTQASAAAVAEACAEDIARFDYRFDPWSGRDAGG